MYSWQNLSSLLSASSAVPCRPLPSLAKYPPAVLFYMQKSAAGGWCSLRGAFYQYQHTRISCPMYGWTRKIFRRYISVLPAKSKKPPAPPEIVLSHPHLFDFSHIIPGVVFHHCLEKQCIFFWGCLHGGLLHHLQVAGNHCRPHCGPGRLVVVIAARSRCFVKPRGAVCTFQFRNFRFFSWYCLQKLFSSR